jgi:hypothetical protein
MALFAAGGIAHAADKAKSQTRSHWPSRFPAIPWPPRANAFTRPACRSRRTWRLPARRVKSEQLWKPGWKPNARKRLELARQQAKKDAEELASTKEAKQRQALEVAQTKARREAAEREKKAERERQLALAEQRAEEEEAAKILEAKQRAALALKEALASSGPSFAEDPVSREQAQRARQEAKEKAAIALKKARESSGPGFADGL